MPDKRVEAIRQFNRLYTKRLGLLRKDYLESSLTLTEARVLFELARNRQFTARRLSEELTLDAGNLSRIIHGLNKRGLLDSKPDGTDNRQKVLWLTAKGKRVFRALDRKASDGIAGMLAELSEAGQNEFAGAAATMGKLLSPRSEAGTPWLLRPHRPGDMGWIIHRNAVVYAREYGWDERYEALVATIAAKFIQNFNPQKERCWIAEKDGAIVGSVMLVRESENISRLRLLLVEAEARGLGIGGGLVNECISFARQAGYTKMVLWTQDFLHAAHRIYQKAGFHLVKEERHRTFGYDMMGQTWNLELQSSRIEKH